MRARCCSSLYILFDLVFERRRCHTCPYMLAVHSVRQFWKRNGSRGVSVFVFAMLMHCMYDSEQRRTSKEIQTKENLNRKKGNERNGMYNILATDSQSAFHVTTPQTHTKLIIYRPKAQAHTTIEQTNTCICPSHSRYTEPCTHLLLFLLLLFMLEFQSLPCCTIPFADSLPMCADFALFDYSLSINASPKMEFCIWIVGIGIFVTRTKTHTHDDLWPLIATYLLIFGLLWPYDCCYIFWLFRAASQNSHLVNRVLFVVHNHSFVFFIPSSWFWFCSQCDLFLLLCRCYYFVLIFFVGVFAQWQFLFRIVVVPQFIICQKWVWLVRTHSVHQSEI